MYDVNGDGKVSSADLKLVIDYIYTKSGKKLVATKTINTILSPLDLPNTNKIIVAAKVASSRGVLDLLSGGTKDKVEQKILANSKMKKAAQSIATSLVNTYLVLQATIH